MAEVKFFGLLNKLAAKKHNNIAFKDTRDREGGVKIKPNVRGENSQKWLCPVRVVWRVVLAVAFSNKKLTIIARNASPIFRPNN